MNIAAYRFGSLVIDGRVYESDVVITPERVLDQWWRKHSHRLAVADLADIVAARPDILVVGTGYFGRMVVCDDARRYLEAQGVVVHDRRTAEAVTEFNQLQEPRQRRVVAALHLTC